MINRFFTWYNRHLELNLSISLGLFLLQIIHLYWLFTDVVLFRLTGQSFFVTNDFWQSVIILVDYTEIPALISASLIYINELRRHFNYKSLIFIILLSSQFLHMFWITDEFVIAQFTNQSGLLVMPVWLAWVAIGIDYLEIPVIIDTSIKLVRSLQTRNLNLASQALNK